MSLAAASTHHAEPQEPTDGPEPDLLMIVPWDDPVVDAVGHDVRSLYVELFWLSVLGPTATWILRRLVQGLDRYPLGYEIDLAETAGAMGLGYTPGTANPFTRSLQRCSLFGAAQTIEGALAVRRKLPPVAHRHLMRMPEALRISHAEWSLRAAPPIEADRERARVLAAAMVEAGDPPDLVERQLLSLGVAPRLAGEATAVAISRGYVRAG